MGIAHDSTWPGSALVGDARSVLRSAVEGAIAIRALAVEPKFLDDLIEAHHVNQRKKARLVVGNPDRAVQFSIL